MAKKISKHAETEKQAVENAVGSRLLVLLAISVVYIFILMFIYSAITGITNILAGFAAIRVMFYASIALLALSVVFFIVRRVRKTDERTRIITGANVLLTFIFFFIASAFIFKYDVSAIKVMYVVVPVWFLLYMIFKLYVREFFTVSLECAVGGAMLFFMYRLSAVSDGVASVSLSNVKSASLALLIIFAVIALLMCVVAALAKKRNGRLGSAEKGLRIASASAKYPPLFIAPLFTVACLLASFAYPRILLYGVFAVIVFWVIMFIYYTYVMMRK